MRGLIYYLGMLSGQSHEFSDSERLSMPRGIGRTALSGRRPMPPSKGTLRFGGLVRKLILSPVYLMLLMLRGMASFFWRMFSAEWALMIDLWVTNLLAQWRRDY